jgi:hypothetical protein
MSSAGRPAKSGDVIPVVAAAADSGLPVKNDEDTL